MGTTRIGDMAKVFNGYQGMMVEVILEMDNQAAERPGAFGGKGQQVNLALLVPSGWARRRLLKDRVDVGSAEAKSTDRGHACARSILRKEF